MINPPKSPIVYRATVPYSNQNSIADNDVPRMRINLISKNSNDDSKWDSEKFLEDISKEPATELITIEEKFEDQLLSYSKIARFFYDGVNFLAKSTYQNIFPAPQTASKDLALENVEHIVELVRLRASTWKPEQSEVGLEESIEEKLQTLGNYHLSLAEISEVDKQESWSAALEYDLKGIVAKGGEALEELVYRGNTTLFIHQNLRKTKQSLKIKVNSETYEVQAELSWNQTLRQKDLEEANKRIPYVMDLSWVTGSVVKPGDMIVPALGLTFTLPQYNGLSFMELRDEYPSREKFLEVLSHEMTHVGTVYLDNPKRRDFLETKAYHVGRGSLMGEFVVAVNARPNLLANVLQYILAGLGFPIPDRFFKHAPKLKSALQIASTTNTFKIVQQRLDAAFGDKGNYILGRLTADEMEEFRYTNDVKARVLMKDNLKWRIMKENLERI